jgi:hypothetical protein
VIGLPVYFHYCGGELEEISVLLKNNSCCGEEEDESTMDAGCCENESTVVRFENDFFIKKTVDLKASELFSTLFLVKLPFFEVQFFGDKSISSLRNFYPPPDTGTCPIIETTFLRI